VRQVIDMVVEEIPNAKAHLDAMGYHPSQLTD
jgi:hypothetical protein